MDLQLADKRALVTGSTSGIGAEIARVLALEGVKVVVHGRDRARAQAVVTEIEAKSGHAAMALGDLMTAEGVETVIKATEQAIGSIDILVNNAGGSNSGVAPGWFETPAEEWIGSTGRMPCLRCGWLKLSSRRCGSADGAG
jgi:3-oxoacyl-[acyl-carrier protein] reductase